MFKPRLLSFAAALALLPLALASFAQGDAPIRIGVPVGLSGANSVVAPSVVQSAQLAVAVTQQRGSAMDLVLPDRDVLLEQPRRRVRALQRPLARWIIRRAPGRHEREVGLDHVDLDRRVRGEERLRSATCRPTRSFA